jgi:NhaP-type Na+/H+ or K+/H+ antiporter
MHNEMLLLTAVLAVGVLCQWAAWRMRIPAIIPLLAAGFLAGPITGLLHPRELLGDLFFPVVSLSVAVILFEGALTLERREISHSSTTLRRLLTVGALITWLGGALAAHLLVGLDLPLAILFGSLIVVTGPTVIGPLLRNVRPTHNLASILKWEGILIDPLGALLAVLVFDFIVAEGSSQLLGLQAVLGFLAIVAIGLTAGTLGALLVALVLKRYLVPDYLRDIFVLAVVLAVFALSDPLRPESGLLSVTVMGIVLANLRLPQLHQVWHFKERLSLMLISALFIILSASISLDYLRALNWRSLLLLAVIMLVLRPLAIFISSIGSKLTRKEKLFLSWIAPRGIVAASVSSLFSFRLSDLGYEEAPLLVTLTFMVIVGTVIIQGATAKSVARWLGVAEAEPQGFLFMGAHPFARRLAASLQDEGFVVRLVDTNWQNVTAARNEGLDDVYYSNILAEASETDLDLGGIGRLLAITSNDEANALACLHFIDDFGSSGVFKLSPRAAAAQPEGSTSLQRFGRLLFHARASYHNLAELVSEGGQIKRTRLTETFTYDRYRAEHNGNFVPLMVFRGHEIRVVTADDAFNPQPGWTIISLVADNLERLAGNPLLLSKADAPAAGNLLAETVDLARKQPRRSD